MAAAALARSASRKTKARLLLSPAPSAAINTEASNPPPLGRPNLAAGSASREGDDGHLSIPEFLLKKWREGVANGTINPKRPPGAERSGFTHRSEREEPSEPPEPELPPPKDADEIFSRFKETGFTKQAAAMLDGLWKGGLEKEAMKLFEVMRETRTMPEVIVYTAIAEAFCKANMPDGAVKIFKMMKTNNVVPNAFTYWVLVKGLGNGGKVDEAVELCGEMIEAGHKPSVATFVGLVEDICKAKGAEEAEKIVKVFKDKGFSLEERAVKEHFDRRGSFSMDVWQAIFGRITEEEFNEYVEKAKSLADPKLTLYALYQQAKVGNINISQPEIFNLKERQKWDAWKAVEGKSKEEAMFDYVRKVKQLQAEGNPTAGLRNRLGTYNNNNNRPPPASFRAATRRP